MRIVTLRMLIGAACCIAPIGATDSFGIWKVKEPASKGSHAGILTVRFAPHVRGEVFTLDRIDGDGRSTTSSTILYLDGKARDFQELECSGTQSSRRVDNRTVEILRQCASGASTRFVRRLAAHPNELILDITEQHAGGRRVERRLVLEKQ